MANRVQGVRRHPRHGSTHHTSRETTGDRIMVGNRGPPLSEGFEIPPRPLNLKVDFSFEKQFLALWLEPTG